MFRWLRRFFKAIFEKPQQSPPEEKNTHKDSVTGTTIDLPVTSVHEDTTKSSDDTEQWDESFLDFIEELPFPPKQVKKEELYEAEKIDAPSIEGAEKHEIEESHTDKDQTEQIFTTVDRTLPEEKKTKPRRFHLGLDWGTSFTKLILRDYGQGDLGNAFVLTPGEGENDFLYPSEVYISDGRVYFGGEAQQRRVVSGY